MTESLRLEAILFLSFRTLLSPSPTQPSLSEKQHCWAKSAFCIAQEGAELADEVLSDWLPVPLAAYACRLPASKGLCKRRAKPESGPRETGRRTQQ